MYRPTSTLWHYYRAMLCTMRNMLSQDVCPYVRLSVTRRYCVETAKHIIKVFFSPSGSHTILRFPYQTSSSSDHVDSVSPLRQPGVSTTASLGPFGTDTEGCTVRDLLYMYLRAARISVFLTKLYQRILRSVRWQRLLPNIITGCAVAPALC